MADGGRWVADATAAWLAGLAIGALLATLVALMIARGRRRSEPALAPTGRALRLGRGRDLALLADLRNLMATAPNRSIIVSPEGAIDGDPLLWREWGCEPAPTRLVQLAEGEKAPLDTAGLALVDAMVAAVRTGSAARQRTILDRHGRTLDVRALAAPAVFPPATVILWIGDATMIEVERARLARRLDESERAIDALTQMIEAAPFPMWYRGPDLALGLVNRAYADAVEIDDAEEVVRRGVELIDGHEAASAGAVSALRSGAAAERLQPATIRGERRWLRVVDVPLSTGAVAGFAIDVHEAEQLKDEVARHIASQRELADHMTAGAIQFDAQRNLDFFNQPFAAMSRIEADWLAERPPIDRLFERMRENGRLPEVRDFPSWKAQRRSWFTSPLDAIEDEWALREGDHWRVVAQPLPEGGLRMIFEDRTEQVRLSAARDTLLRVRTATFDHLFEAIAVFAADGRLQLWNRRFIETWSLEAGILADHPRIDDFVPALAARLVDREGAARIRDLVQQTANGRRLGSGRVALADGRHFEFAAVPLPDGNAMLAMVDVTDSTRIEAALRERTAALEAADQVKTDFVANMSYELRTPLTSIGGFAEMMAAGYAGELSERGHDYVQSILDSVDRLSRLVDDVLNLTLFDSGALTLDRQRIDMAGLVRHAADRVRSKTTDRKQQFDVHVAADLGHLSGDARRLSEALDHLLGNAIGYTPRGGQIVLEAEGDADEVRVTVRDDGPGISAADQRHVFDRFHRRVGRLADGAEPPMPGSVPGSDGGLGLGLPLTRQFVEAHGGRLSLRSDLGAGTSVTMHLPRGGTNDLAAADD